MNRNLFWGGLAVALLLSRLAHVGILWADEDYHLAAGIQMLYGKIPYRDFWYDKPPLAALGALLFGAFQGWPLRVAGSAMALGGCLAAFRLANELWTEREGYWAAGLLVFFQIFNFAPAILPWEPDTLMIVPHLLAVYFSIRGRWFLAGVMVAAAFLLNPKGLVILAVCLLFGGARSLPRLLAGFVVPCALITVWLFSSGAFTDYVEQVWRWGLLYASTPGSDPQAQKGWLAIAGWAGFHAAVVVAAVYSFQKDRNGKLAMWAVLMFATTLVGLRFAPRYFVAPLAALVIPAARGLGTLPRKGMWAVLLLLAIPLVRFGPRYVSLGAEALLGTPHSWQDVAMDQESRRTAEWIKQRAKPGDTIAIWGYRPNVVVYARLPVSGRFWDSQPLTGVPADRHLSDARPLDTAWAARNRAEFVQSAPTFLVDGLSGYNPALGPRQYSDLEPWMGHYCEGTRVGLTTVYQRCR